MLCLQTMTPNYIHTAEKTSNSNTSSSPSTPNLPSIVLPSLQQAMYSTAPPSSFMYLNNHHHQTFPIHTPQQQRMEGTNHMPIRVSHPNTQNTSVLQQHRMSPSKQTSPPSPVKSNHQQQGNKFTKSLEDGKKPYNKQGQPPKKISKSSKLCKKSKISISVSDLIRVMPLPQTVAAQKLGVSLSTLKRRFYELGMGRWPGLATSCTQQHFTDHISEESHDSYTDSSVKGSLSYVLNGSDIDSTHLDQITLAVLNFTFKQYL